MKWTTQADIQAQVQKLWDKELILASYVDDATLFPRRLSLVKPTSKDLTENFDAARTWIAELRQGTHFRIEMREIQHRVLGANTVPDAVWIDSRDNALALIGKTKDAMRYTQLVTLTRDRQPSLLPWIAIQPLRALELTTEWPLFLDVVSWMQAHPRPNIYIRQMDIPGVHTKFVETHRAVLGNLFDLALPPFAIDSAWTGVSQFCRRYGFIDKPLRIRFRLLDPQHTLLVGDRDSDFTVNEDAFANLAMPPMRVFITENEINYLAFPPIANSLVIFGGGYGFGALVKAKWLEQCTLYYWGDIDTHGFAILDQLRHAFPLVKSFLMDRETLLEHTSQWGEEPQPTLRDLPRLTEEESALYDDLRDNRLRKALRLEQERIGFGWVQRVLGRCVVSEGCDGVP